MVILVSSYKRYGISLRFPPRRNVVDACYHIACLATIFHFWFPSLKSSLASDKHWGEKPWVLTMAGLMAELLSGSSFKPFIWCETFSFLMSLAAMCFLAFRARFQLHVHWVAILWKPWLTVVGMVRVTYLLRMAEMTSGSSFQSYGPRKQRWWCA